MVIAPPQLANDSVQLKGGWRCERKWKLCTLNDYIAPSSASFTSASDLYHHRLKFNVPLEADSQPIERPPLFRCSLFQFKSLLPLPVPVSVVQY